MVREAQSKPRTVTLTRSSLDEEIGVAIKGGKESGFGLFVANVSVPK
jgi:hypothetical protein